MHKINYCNTPKKREQGLMFTYSLPKNEGMLFRFDKEKIIRIWMKNTYIPLDIIWLDKYYTIQKIEYNTTPLSLVNLYHPKKSKFVIEINAGKANELNLKNRPKKLHLKILTWRTNRILHIKIKVFIKIIKRFTFRKYRNL